MIQKIFVLHTKNMPVNKESSKPNNVNCVSTSTSFSSSCHQHSNSTKC